MNEPSTSTDFLKWHSCVDVDAYISSYLGMNLDSAWCNLHQPYRFVYGDEQKMQAEKTKQYRRDKTNKYFGRELFNPTENAYEDVSLCFNAGAWGERKILTFSTAFARDGLGGAPMWQLQLHNKSFAQLWCDETALSKYTNSSYVCEPLKLQLHPMGESYKVVGVWGIQASAWWNNHELIYAALALQFRRVDIDVSEQVNTNLSKDFYFGRVIDPNEGEDDTILPGECYFLENEVENLPGYIAMPNAWVNICKLDEIQI